MRDLVLLLAAASFLSICNLGAEAQAPEPSEGSHEALHQSTPDTHKQLSAVVEAQLTAFRKNDYPGAYVFAAEEIQQMFDVVEFEAMVRGAYPAIAQSGAALFGIAIDNGDHAMIEVRVEDQQQHTFRYRYLLKRQAGEWRISGVTEVPNDTTSA